MNPIQLLKAHLPLKNNADLADEHIFCCCVSSTMEKCMALIFQTQYTFIAHLINAIY